MLKRVLYHIYGKSTSLKGKRLTKEGVFTLVILIFLSKTSIGFALLLTLFLCSLIWNRFIDLRLDAARSLSKFGTVGEPLEYRIVLHNRSSTGQKGLLLVEDVEGIPLTVEEFVSTQAPDEKNQSLFERIFLVYRRQWLRHMKQGVHVQEYAVPSILPHGDIELKAVLMPVRRGYIHLSGLTIARPDPFNFSRALYRIPLRQSVLILPKRYDIPLNRLPGHRKFKLGGMTLISSIGESQEFMSLRDYRPGDSLRHIHWKSWAKTGKPVVKEYQEEYFVRHALILDTFQSAAYSDLFEEAVSLAASFAFTIKTQDSLLDLMFVGAEAFCFTVGRGLGYTEHMLGVLASVTPCQKKSFKTLPPLVFEHASLLSGCICILLTWDEERQQFIQTLQALGVPVLVFVVTNPDAALPFLEPAETDVTIHRLEVGKIEEGLTSLGER